MKFYFCETCGKRITDTELEAGKGKDKKLKGIYCGQCAVGVMTMESAPISESKAREILAQENEGKKKEDRHPTSGRLQAARRIGSPESAGSGKENNSLIYIWGGLGAAIVVVGIMLMLKGGGEASTAKPAQASENRLPDPVRQPPFSNGKPAKPSSSSGGSPRTQPEEIAPSSTPETLNREARAQAAYEALKTKLANPGTDEDEKASEVENFFKVFSDTIVASRARSELSKRKDMPASAIPEIKPQAQAPDTLNKSPSNIPTSLKFTFDEDHIYPLSAGSVDDAPPEGAHGKALKLEKKPNSLKGAISIWGLEQNLPKGSKDIREALYTVTAGSKIRFRYYCIGAMHIEIYAACFNDGLVYLQTVDGIQNGRWTEFVLPISELKCNNKSIEPGWASRSLVINFLGKNLETAYIDDLEIADRDPVAGGEKEPGSLQKPTAVAPVTPAATVDSSEALYDGLSAALALMAVEGRKEEAGARLAAAERDPAMASQASKLARWRKIVGWLDALNQALPQGIEKLKDEDSFEMRLTAGAPVTVGKRADYQIQKFDNGVITVEGKGASIPLPLEKLHPETRAQLILLGLGSDASGRLLRAAQSLIALGIQKKDAILDEGLLDAAVKAGAGEEDAAAVRQLALAIQGTSKDEKEAGAAFASIEKLAAAKDAARLGKEILAFREQFSKTAFASRHAKELDAWTPLAEFSIVACADTYVQQSTPTENLGTKKELVVKTDTNLTRYTFIRFDLSAMPGKIEKATLRLYPGKMQDKKVSLQVDYVADTKWTETGLTWANKPDGLGPAVPFTQEFGHETAIDVTTFVQAAKKDKSASFRISSPSNQGGKAIGIFVSRESDDESQRPTLLLKLAP